MLPDLLASVALGISASMALSLVLKTTVILVFGLLGGWILAGRMLAPDVGVTALSLAACYAFWRLSQSPSWWKAIAAGALLDARAEQEDL